MHSPLIIHASETRPQRKGRESAHPPQSSPATVPQSITHHVRKTCGFDPKSNLNQKCRVLRSERIELTAVVTASALRDSMFKRNVYCETSTLSPTHTQASKVPAPYGVQRPFASNAALVRTASQTTASTALSRCSWPTADSGIIVSNSASEANACACR